MFPSFRCLYRGCQLTALERSVFPLDAEHLSRNARREKKKFLSLVGQLRLYLSWLHVLVKAVRLSELVLVSI